ncbi:MAG: thioredoxin domain-containing protein [Patescibacteria group bacterium]
MEENKIEHEHHHKKPLNMAWAIVIAGALIAGAILIKGSIKTPMEDISNNKIQVNHEELKPVSTEDRMLGNKNAKITMIAYEDFQCPFCGKFFREAETDLRNKYVKNGSVNFIYRDFAFLGEESTKAGEAALCANDQGKFWEYHDYLFTHQNGENKGSFANPYLKSFAKELGLNQNDFDKCLDSEKYAKTIADSTEEGGNAGVRGTPKAFILKDGKLVDTIDGAEPSAMVMDKIEKALK